jgi:hypothetical protein|tara:strand:+ start:220 stop:369 length:150 start_codon:yes stop_codon:yes gene_type:complete
MFALSSEARRFKNRDRSSFANSKDWGYRPGVTATCALADIHEDGAGGQS